MKISNLIDAILIQDTLILNTVHIHVLACKTENLK